MIYKHQERLIHVGLPVFCEAIVPTNDNNSLLWMASKCITVPFEGSSSLLESTESEHFLCDCMLSRRLEIC